MTTSTLTTKTISTTRPMFTKYAPRLTGAMALLGGLALLVPACGELPAGEESVSSFAQAVTTVGETLSSGSTLLREQQLESANGHYRAIMQDDGNFVVYQNATGRSLWASGVGGGAGSDYRLTMQSDGNLVVYDRSGGAKWSAGSFGSDTNYFLKLDNNGGLTVYAGTPGSPGEKRWQSKSQQYQNLAKKYRPALNFHVNHACYGLTFRESGVEPSELENHCRTSFSNEFVVVASVVESPDDRPNTFRITYGVPFGWQSGTTGAPAGLPVSLPGAHGNDAQYLVVDVVDGRVISVWADMHQGSYARTRDGGLTMYTGDRVTAWVGAYYNSLKLIDDTTHICKSNWINPDISIASELVAVCSAACVTANSCGVLDTILNFGDYVGTNKTNEGGRLVMADHACSARTDRDYVSADGITYTSKQLKGLRNYVGCTGAATPWDGGKSAYRSKEPVKTPYSLMGCKSGAASDGGDICNASHFRSDRVWQTSGSFRNMYLELRTGGSADVDYTAGTPFNTIDFIKAVPRSVSIRSGSRVDAIAVEWTNGTGANYGGSGGGVKTLAGLEADPVVAVEVCNVTYNGKLRLGHIKFVAQSGRFMEGGNGYDNCVTTQPAGKRFLGFYGRYGGEMDLVGTIWGDR